MEAEIDATSCADPTATKFSSASHDSRHDLDPTTTAQAFTSEFQYHDVETTSKRDGNRTEIADPIEPPPPSTESTHESIENFLEDALRKSEGCLSIDSSSTKPLPERLDNIAKIATLRIQKVGSAGEPLSWSGSFVRFVALVAVVTIHIAAISEICNHDSGDSSSSISLTDYVVLFCIHAASVVGAEWIMRLASQPSLMHSLNELRYTFFRPRLFKSLRISVRCLEHHNKHQHSLLKIVAISRDNWKERAEQLAFPFTALTRTFDDAVASQKMLKAQNAALNIHIQLKTDAFVSLTAENAALKAKLHHLQLLHDDTSAAPLTPSSSTPYSQLAHNAALAEITLLRGQAQSTYDEASAHLQEADAKMAQADAATQRAQQTQAEATRYSRETTELCDKMRRLMRETELLECERMTQLRKLSERRYGEGLVELERLEEEVRVREDEEGVVVENGDSDRAGEEKGEGAGGDDDNDAGGGGDAVDGVVGSEGKELTIRPVETVAFVQQRKKAKKALSSVLKGRYNSFLPAFRYAEGAPRLASGARIDASARLRASDYALAWPVSVQGLVEQAADQARAAASGGGGKADRVVGGEDAAVGRWRKGKGGKGNGDGGGQRGKVGAGMLAKQGKQERRY